MHSIWSRDLKVSNLNSSGLDFTKLLVLKNTMCHDFATKLNLKGFNLGKVAFLVLGSIQLSNQFVENYYNVLTGAF